MRLQIENLAKIVKADINIDGITVIAGENNTGKSTIGKALYCIFNSLYDLEDKIFSERENSVWTILRALPLSYDIRQQTILGELRSKKHSDFVYELLKKAEKVDADFLGRLSTDAIIKYASESKLDDTEIRDFSNKLYDVLNVSREDVLHTIISKYLNSEFKGQINHVNYPRKVSRLNLKLREKEIDLEIENDEITEMDLDARIYAQALYIDDPFIINRLDENSFLSSIIGDEHSKFLLRCLKDKVNDNVVDETILKKKMSTILENINTILNGDFVKGESQEEFQEKGFRKSFRFSNLASGLKTFVILKKLLQNGVLVEKGVLILDEPEVHLHPEWQLQFAEIIVLLQKELNLHVLLTTHSPYFLRAIEVYSAKHLLADRCHYYMTKLEKDKVEIVDATTCTDEIYKMLAEPFAILDRIRLGEREI